MPQLISASGHALALPRLPCRIGTAESNDVPIQAGLGVAGHHLTFHEQDGQIVVEDSGSGLGTFINGQPIQRQLLVGGEMVRIGKLELRFDSGRQAPSPSEKPPTQAVQAKIPPAQPAQVQPVQVAQAQPVQPTMQPAPVQVSPTPALPEQPAMPPVSAQPSAAALPQQPVQQAPAQPAMPPQGPPVTEQPPAAPVSPASPSAMPPQGPPVTEQPQAAVPVSPASPSAMPAESGFPEDQRAGLPPVDDRPAEAPLKDLFPKPSQGDSPHLGTMRRREKPSLGGSVPSERPVAASLSKNTGTPSKRSRMLPIILGACGLLVATAAGLMVWMQKPAAPVASASGNADGGSATVSPVASVSNPYADMVGKLASLTRPAVVISVDVGALRRHGVVDAVPRLEGWLEKYLSLPLSEVERVVGVGASSEDFSLGVTPVTPVSLATLTERLGDADAENVFHLDALSGPLAVRLESDGSLIVTHRDKASASLAVTPLPDDLKGLLQERGENAVLVSVDHSLIDRGNLPFFLPQSADTLLKKSAALVFGEPTFFEASTEHATASLADSYAKAYREAIGRSLSRLEGLDATSVELALKSLKVQSKDVSAKSLWVLPDAESTPTFSRGLVEMIADPLGVEVANASVQVLKQEAQRMAALFYSAGKSTAPLNEITNVEAAIVKLMGGVKGKDKSGERTFKTRNYSSWEREVMAKFLEFDGETLTYRQEGFEPEEFGKTIDSKRVVEGSDEVEMRSRRNAATVAAAYRAAQSSGAPLSSNINNVFDQLAKGLEVDGTRYAVNLSKEERAQAKVFLRLQGSELVLVEGDEE